MGVFAPFGASAEGNLAANGTDLDELEINMADLTFSETEYQLETGQYYRLEISSDGSDEIDFAMPELLRNSWINQVSVGEVSISLAGFDEISFGDEETVEISFVPVRPGEYDFYVPGYETRGLIGKFVVK
ncbi:MAG: hypothetical protein HY834_17395 [Devosia nanyangense]|uniref:Copper-binding protein n=1 Tax=Devosia nanyangense TaxID=1228055 RepID=A0A933L5M6_9HYPH|nr:hypothetical protein [Devosia nanyangense]MDO8360120.1 hypothetical protein [Devosia sp.]